MSDRTPNYLSVASADLILSEIRPTKVKPEALLAFNIILDEILWLLLNAARSLATERLNRDGLMKILPTGLGKDALLEAEVELKAYWDRTDPVDRGSTIEHNSKLAEFPLQAAFELMRAKCEVYSTLGDAEEDIEEEDRLQNQMMLASPGPPRASAVAPAALYITAMLEHICEHILTNVAKVVARDSSRTTAHVQDIYVALCEDEAIYPLFKRMKVKEQLEAQAKAASKPRRSRSINTHQQNGRRSPSSTLRGSTSSPQPRPSDAVSVGTNKVARTSEESSGTSGPPATSPPRKSGEKSRLKMFGRGGGTSADQEVYYSSRHQRSDSSMSDTTRRTAAGLSDSADEYHHDPRSDFEDLMRSGTTMKVSLTPDRLRSFEVFAKEKSQRNGRSSSVSSVNPPPPVAPDLVVPMPASAPSVQPSFKLANKGSRSNLVARPPQTVESIEEDEDEEGYGGSTSANGGTGPRPPGVNKPRSRTQSLAQFLQEAPPWEKDAPLESVAMGGSGAMSVPNTAVPKIVTGRARSQTTGSGGPSPISTAPSTTLPTPSSAAAPNVKKKTSGYLTPVAGSAPPSAFRPVPKVGPVPEGRRGPAKNIEDIDLDDLLADDDDEASSINTAAASINTAAASTNGGQPRKGALGGRKNSLTGSTAVSASTREMIDFLSEGPPPSPPASSPKTPIKEVQPTKSKGSGRFGRMISKLARSSSTEAMSFDKKKGGSVEDVSRQSSSGGSYRAPNAAPLPQWTRPTPPPPPPVIPVAQPAPVAPSPTTPTQSANPPAANPPAVIRARAGSSARKPAPPFPTTTPSPLSTSTEPSQTSVSASPAVTPTRSRLSSMRSRPSTAPSSAAVPVPELPATVPVEVEAQPKDEPTATSAPQEPVLAHTETTTSTLSSGSEQPTRSLSDKSIGTDAIEVEPSVPAPAQEVAAPAAPEVPAGSVFVDAERAQLMRSMIGRATSVEECQILVEMFLAQWGVPRTAEEQDEPEPEETDKELKAEEEAHGPPLVETLLGDAAACEANVDDNQTDDAHDVPRTPKTPTDILHSEEPSTTSTAAEPYSADPYQKNLDSNMLPSVSHPIIAA